jgi:LacI family transcriptional regulator, galactose operon repressor
MPLYTVRVGRSITIFDVAHEAGVSKSTVSNVVRGVDEVSDETRQRVLAVIEKLNYKPNGIARQFVKRRTTMIGVLVGDLGNAYHAHLAQVVERALFRRGHTAMFCNIEGDEELAIAGVEALLEQRVAGFVFLALIERTPQLAASLRRTDVPIVAIGLRQEWSDSVGPRDREGGRLAARHLLDLGHRRIGYVRTAAVEAGGDRARNAGYTAELRDAGVEPAAAMWWEPGSGTIRVGRRPMPLRDALSGPGAPTAVFVWNDHGAIGLIEACEGAGIAVPAGLSVVGFDNIAMAGLSRIALTTVAQPLDFQAEKAVAMLLDRINGTTAGKPRHLSVPVELRVRGSTAAPRRSRART